MNLESVKEAVLPKWMEDHPLTKKIKADLEAENLAKRQEAAGKIEALRKKQADSRPKLQADIEAKEAKFKKAKAALDIAGGEFQAARHSLSRESYKFDSEIRIYEAILLETADPLIDEAILLFRDKIDDLRKPGRITSRGMETEKNMFTETVTRTTETNSGAVLGAMRYCMAAIKKLEELKLVPEFSAEKIQELKDALPSIDVWQEVTGEKPFERINTDPRSFLPSDSEMDWKIGKLNEKFKKLIRK